VRSPSGTVFMMVGYQGPDMGEPEAMEERLSMEEEAARLAALRAEREAFAQVLGTTTMSSCACAVLSHANSGCYSGCAACAHHLLLCV
jgi:hypothetical protein